MRRILLIVLFTASFFILPAQKNKLHVGLYLDSETHYHRDNRVFYFGKDSSFVYLESTEQTKFGIGKYKCKGDSLILNFAHSEKPEGLDKKLLELTSTPGVSDTLEVMLSVFGTNDGEELISASIYDERVRLDPVTGKRGHGRVKIARGLNQKITLRVSWFGYDTLYIPIEPNVSQIAGKVYLTDLSFYKEGEQLSFLIKKWTTSKRIIKPIVSYYTDQKVHKKMKPKEVKYWVGSYYYALLEAYIPKSGSD